MSRSFAVFILSNRRPDNIITIRTLERLGYDGPLHIIVDTDDPTLPEYVERYGDRVVTFDKEQIAQTFDGADLSTDRRTVVYARNACWQIAHDLGYDYFLQLDDDYTQLRFRRERGNTLLSLTAPRIGGLFDWMLDFLDESGADVVAFSQGGDFIGGVAGAKYYQRVLRKAMNAFFCRTSDTWRFVGRVNEDVNLYTAGGFRGLKCFTITACSIEQTSTQQSSGGMTEMYLDNGTYVKSFYPFMMVPSAVSIAMMSTKYQRIHHKVSGKNCYPRIIPETYRKPR